MENVPPQHSDQQSTAGNPPVPPPASDAARAANSTQMPLPNATAVLVLGIISIVTCFCYGIIGLTLGIIALVLASKAMQLYKAAPQNYTEASFKNMNAGRVCAIIGTILSGIYMLVLLIYFFIVGAAIFSGASIFGEMFDQI